MPDTEGTAARTITGHCSARLSHAPDSPEYMELGLTVTFSNGGDYFNPNTENVVFKFFPSGAITYKRWLHSTKTFTEGMANVIACPA